MAVKIYNTLTRCKEEFKPLSPPEVGLYICGPTVYDFIHIGNARVFIMFDIIRRYLQFRGYTVKMVQNYTDIDDKMIARAAEQGITVPELAALYITAYQEDAKSLGVKPADVHPLATEHMTQIIALISRLEEKEIAYVSHGDVYFDTSRFADYGALSQQNREELLAGARVDPGEKKRHPLDFVLWKQRKPGEPFWASPWGEGRPGWHIECSAMARCYLGETVDIHAGGSDLIFPHHENEIAQSLSATGKPLARYWLHAGYLNIEDKKMSKSLGNVLTVRSLLKQYNPLDLRYYILSAHYRSPLNFSRELVYTARTGRERLQETIDNLQIALEGAEGAAAEPEDRLQEALAHSRRDFLASMDDDFNTAGAAAELFALARQCNIYLKEGHPYNRGLVGQVLDFYNEADCILEILDLKSREMPERSIMDAITRRDQARLNKNWDAADSIRAELLAQGYLLEDTAHGTRWKRR